MKGDDKMSKEQNTLKDQRLDFLTELSKREDIKEYLSKDDNCREYAAMLFAYLLDYDEDFIRIVSKYRRRYIDRLLIDSRLV